MFKSEIDKVQSLFEIRYFILWFSFRFNCAVFVLEMFMRLNISCSFVRSFIWCAWIVCCYDFYCFAVCTIFENNSPLKVCLFFNTIEYYINISMQRHRIHLYNRLTIVNFEQAEEKNTEIHMTWSTYGLG